MEIEKGATFELPPRTLEIIALPMAMIIASSVLIGFFGHLFNPTHQPLATGHAEAAGRLRMLATWLLFTAMTIACLWYFASNARIFTPATNRRLTFAYYFLALLEVAFVLAGLVEGAPRFFDERAMCEALGGSPIQYDGLMLRLNAWLDLRPSCADSQFVLLWGLNDAQKMLLALLAPALVLGTISCLAVPPEPTERDYRFQARRLNTYLCLAATVLVLGLLFISALLRWPGSGLAGNAAEVYGAHVDAYVLYSGVSYSVFIASYYVPVAIRLTKACEYIPVGTGDQKKGTSPSTDDAPNPAEELFSLLKTGAVLFAPAIAGVAGSVLHV